MLIFFQRKMNNVHMYKIPERVRQTWVHKLYKCHLNFGTLLYVLFLFYSFLWYPLLRFIFEEYLEFWSDLKLLLSQNVDLKLLSGCFFSINFPEKINGPEKILLETIDVVNSNFCEPPLYIYREKIREEVCTPKKLATVSFSAVFISFALIKVCF